MNTADDDVNEKAANRRLWLIIFGGWTLFGAGFAFQSYLQSVYYNRPIDLGRSLVAWLSCGYLWALLTPFVLRLARRFPFERGRWQRNLIVHFFVGSLFSLVQLGVYVFVREWLLPDERAAQPFSPVRSFQNLFVGEFHMNLLLYGTVVGLAQTVDYYRRFRERERRAAQLELEAAQLETQLARAQLDALKMQLHPHFLFNTLNSIAVLMREDVGAANRMLVRLSELLRAALKNTSANEVTLKQELEFLRGYLEIEQVRFQDRLEVEIEAAPNVLEAKVPNLILQPLVENAIRHAVAPRADATLVEIRAERSDGHLQLIVRDDGDCLVEFKNPARQGIGLANTKARLEKLYGSNHDFQIVTAPGGGWQVLISIPFQQGERTNE